MQSDCSDVHSILFPHPSLKTSQDLLYTNIWLGTVYKRLLEAKNNIPYHFTVYVLGKRMLASGLKLDISTETGFFSYIILNAMYVSELFDHIINTLI